MRYDILHTHLPNSATTSVCQDNNVSLSQKYPIILLDFLPAPCAMSSWLAQSHLHHHFSVECSSYCIDHIRRPVAFDFLLDIQEGPEKMKELVASATSEFHNQYPPMFGIPELRQAVARHSQTYTGIEVKWDSETLITVGATEAIAAAFLGILNAGDEVIMFDPMYDAYGSMARRAGGKVKAVKLNEQDWSVDRSHLKEAFSDRTKLVVVNTPHNPTGKVFSTEDLRFIADLAIQYNAYVLLDEVRPLNAQ